MNRSSRSDQEDAVTKCYVCDREKQPTDLNWSKDKRGEDRCPRHPQGERGTFTTLGQIIETRS